MNKINGILMLLIYVCLVTALMPNEGLDFLKEFNISNLARRIALFGIIGVGVAFVIITGGIDLSIGSLIGLMGCTLAILLEVDYHGLDSMAVKEISGGANTVRVEPDRSLELSPGDRIAVFDGKPENQGIYSVEEVQSDSGATQLTIDSSFSEDDALGSAIRVFAIDDVDRDYYEIVTAEIPELLSKRDRLLYFPAGFERAEQLRVANIVRLDGEWRIQLSKLPADFSRDGHFAVYDRRALPIWLAVSIVLALSILIGMIHGLLITKLSLQPFVVTLCGLLVYRGIARTLTNDQTVGFGNEYVDTLSIVAKSQPASVPLILLIAGVALAIATLGWLVVTMRQNHEQRTKNAFALPMMVFVLGLVFIFIGSSRFWFGFEAIAEGPSWSRYFSPDTKVDPAGVGKPALLMRMIGWLFVPSALAFLAVGFRREPVRVGKGAIALVISIAVLILGRQLCLQLGQSWELSPLNASRLNLFGLLIVVGQFFVVLGYVIRSVLSANQEWGKVLLFATTMFVIIWLSGFSALGETLVPAPFFVLVLVALMAGVFLNFTIYGRYMLALGSNEQAARFSGIRTDRMTILAYVICSTCAGLGGILFALDLNSIQPATHGNFYEVYAIAAAVLGGCSLRGGEGSIIGVLIGAAVMQTLRNSISLLDAIPEKLEFAIIGVVILIGAIADELTRRLLAIRRAKSEAETFSNEKPADVEES